MILRAEQGDDCKKVVFAIVGTAVILLWTYVCIMCMWISISGTAPIWRVEALINAVFALLLVLTSVLALISVLSAQGQRMRPCIKMAYTLWPCVMGGLIGLTLILIFTTNDSDERLQYFIGMEYAVYNLMIMALPAVLFCCFFGNPSRTTYYMIPSGWTAKYP